MKHVRIFGIFSLLLIMGNCCSNIWRQRAQKDLELIYVTLKESHPGAVNPVKKWEPSFHQWLEQGYQEASKHLHSVSDYQTYKYLLFSYVKGFLDNHLWVSTKHKEQGYAENWQLPFIYTYTGKEVIVTKSNDERIACGDILVSVDAAPTRQFLEKAVSYFSSSPKLEASLFKITRFLSLFPENPFFARPKIYTFKTGNGKLVDYATKWEKTTESFSSQKVSEFSIQELPNNCTWISIPNFYPNKDEEKQINHIISTIKNYRNSKTIIFDLRNNGGGNSTWGTTILKALVGKKHFAHMKPADTIEYLRASKDNLKKFQEYQKIFSTQFTSDHPIQQEIKEEVDGMQKALNNNEPFFIITPKKLEPKTKFHKSKLNPSTKVFCIINEYCVSSALIFIDELKQVTNPTLIGHPTSSDTNFNDIREIVLPSGYSSLFIPMKFEAGKKRKSRECYMPGIYLYNTMQDTQKLQTYVIENIVT